MINEAMIEEYTENIDTSEMIIEYYKRRKTQDLERYFLKIEEWLQRDVAPGDNKPLVIDSDLGIEKKTLLIKWMSYHEEQSKKKYKDFIIPHFAGTGGKSSNIFYAMYKILVGMREHFNISQKVELLESKILMYFNYWLDLCHKTINGRVVDDSVVILVFDSIDLFRDSNTEDTSVALWLSQSFPSRIKVIVTAEAQSDAMRHFKKNGCKVLKAQGEPFSPLNFIGSHPIHTSFCIDTAHRERVIDILQKKSDDVLRDPLFMKTYLSTLLPGPVDGIIEEDEINKQEFKSIFKKFDYRALERITNLEELSLFVLDYYSHNITDHAKFRDIFIALTISEKGLSSKEIMALTKVSQKEWNSIVAVFETFMMKYKALWKISDAVLIKAITQRFIQNNPGYVVKLHSDIADALTGTSNSLRKLEEETYHLFQCKAYFRLKEAVTNIENFLLLFNPRNKYELCRYWQVLEQNGFDPSLEYTTAIEGFDLRYHPTPEQTFMIILQISRFLQEFGDFETRSIPDYRHPPIAGGQELKDIGLKREIEKLGMYISDQIDSHNPYEKVEELEHQLAREFPEYNSAMIKEFARQIHNANEKRKRELERKLKGYCDTSLYTGIAKTEEDEDALDATTETQYKAKMNRGSRNVFASSRSKLNSEEHNLNRKDLPVLNSIEALNVDIPKHREEFIRFYVDQQKAVVKQIITEHHELEEEEELVIDGHVALFERPSLNTTAPSDRSVATIGNDENGSKFKKLVIPDQAGETQPTFYYYKRWLWMMFPWVCLSYKNNYSKIIFECFSSPTKYISVSNERERTMQALRLALESKIKKELIYAKPGDKTQFAILKNLKKVNLGFTTSRKSLKALPTQPGLPPLEKEASIFNATKTKESNGLGTSIKKPARLGDLSPIKQRESDRPHPQTTKSMKRKGNHLFVTGNFANNDKTNTSFSTINNNNTVRKSIQAKPASMNDLDERVSVSKTRTNTGTFSTDRPLFADQRIQNMLKNADEAIEYMIRPTFMNSVFQITPKQLEMFETKVIQLKKDMNDLAQKNKAAGEKLKHFMSLGEGLDARGANDITERTSVRITKLQEDIIKAEEQQKEVMQHGERLQMIIDVCNKNKTQNELYIHNLNYLVTNFKKAISYEEKSIDTTQREIFVLQQTANKMIEEYGEKMGEHQKAMQGLKKEAKMRRDVINKIQETQEKLQRMVSDTTEESSTDDRDGEGVAILTKEQMERIREKERYDLENLEDMREQVDQIRDVIGLDFETPKFKDFVHNLEKMSDFEQAIYQTETDIEKLQEEHAVHNNFLVTYRKARFADRRMTTMIRSEYDHIKDEDKLQALVRDRRRQNEDLNRSIHKNTKLVLDAKNTLVKICTKIGLEIDDKTLLFTQLPAEEIAARLQERLQAVKKIIPEDEFERFKSGKVDFEPYYKERGYDFEISKSHIFNNNTGTEKEMGSYKGRTFAEQYEPDMA